MAALAANVCNVWFMLLDWTSFAIEFEDVYVM